MAEDTNPETVAVGIDIELAAAEVDILVNDVPILDPAEPLGGADQITTQLRLNAAFRKGRNTVTVRVRLIPDSQFGYDPVARVDFGYWDFFSNPFMFDGRPMAASLTVQMEGSTQALTSDAPGQPLMQATRPLPIPVGETTVDGWQSYAFDVDVNVDLPSFAWMDGQLLTDVPDLRAQLVAAMQHVHGAMASGPAPARDVLDGFVTRQAAAVGATPEEFFQFSILPILDGSQNAQIVPFSIENAELRLFGNGRLATFVPIPHRFRHTETGAFFTFFFYFWKDNAGQWHVIN